MAEGSYYDEEAADHAVLFIEQLCHTKGKWERKKFHLMAWQEQIIRDIFGVMKANGKRQFTTAYIEIPKKNGKELALDTKIPTPDGWTTMGDIQVGDSVFDEEGMPCHVVAKSPVDDTEQAYKLTFKATAPEGSKLPVQIRSKDGKTVYCNETFTSKGEKTPFEAEFTADYDDPSAEFAIMFGAKDYSSVTLYELHLVKTA